MPVVLRQTRGAHENRDLVGGDRVNRDQRYSASKKGKARSKRRESSEYRRGYRNGYKAGERKTSKQ